MRLLIFVFALLIAWAMLCSCGSEDGAQPTAVGSTESPGESPFHGVRPPQEYFRILSSQLQADLETLGIPPQSSGPLDKHLTVTESDYLAALNKTKSEGLGRLSQEEMMAVLFVSTAALAAQQETVSYAAVAIDPISGAQIGHLIAEEVYRFDARDGYSIPNLVRRRVVSEEMAWDFGGSPHYAINAPQEVLESYDFANLGKDDEKVMRIRCERIGEVWSRYVSDYTEQYALDWPLRVFPNVEYSSPGAEPQGIEIIQGRPAYKLTELGDFGLCQGTERRYWLDKETLWPLQWEFEVAGGPAQSLGWDYQGRGSTVRGTVEQVNGEIDVPQLREGEQCGG